MTLGHLVDPLVFNVLWVEAYPYIVYVLYMHIVWYILGIYMVYILYISRQFWNSLRCDVDCDPLVRPFPCDHLAD